MKLQELVEKRAALIAEARTLLENDTNPDGGEAEARHQEIMAEVSALGNRIDAIRATAAAEADVAEQRAALADLIDTPAGGAPEDRGTAEDKQLRAAMQEVLNHQRKSVFIPFGENRIMAQQDLDEIRRFGINARVPRERRTDILAGDTSTVYSGYLVPTTLLNRIQYHANAESGVLKTNAYQLYTRNGENIDVPKLVTDASAAATAEGTASTVTNPVFGKVTLRSLRQDGHFVVSREMLDDSIVDIERVLGDLAGRALATKIASQLAAGDGTGDPYGINYTTELSTSGKTAASATTFTMDELLDLRLSVLPRYRMRGEWVMSSTAFAILAKLKDGSNRYYLTASGAPGEPDTLMGQPVYEDAGFQAVATGNAPVVYGDWSTFWIRWARGGVEFARDDSVGFTSFESYFRFAVWMDSNIVDATGSLKHLTML